MLKSNIEQWKIGIREESRLEGLEKGMEKGEAILLSRQLELKFGPLPNWAQVKIAGAHKDALENWGLKLLNAQSHNEVFSWETHRMAYSYT